MSSKMFLMLVPLSLCSLSCKDDSIVISNADSLVDPRVAPRIIFSYPPLNSHGPYSDWEVPVSNYPAARFELRFNKIMDRSSVRRAVRLASSLRSLTVDTNFVSDNSREYFSFSPAELYTSQPAFRLGELLTLSFAHPVADVNGNLIAEGVLGTFLPEPSFRVQYIWPPAGYVLDPREGFAVYVFFNSKIDSTILPFVTTSPEMRGAWSIYSDSASMFMPMQEFQAAQFYDVRISPGAPDKSGHTSLLPFAARFLGRPFKVLYRSGTSGGGAFLGSSVDVTFSFPVDTSTLRRAFHISPDVIGGLSFESWSDYPLVRFLPASQYSESTRYAVRIDTTLLSDAGIHLSEEYAFSFLTSKFRIAGGYPSDGALNVSTSSGISADFTGELDSSTIRRSFHISPPADGSFPFLVNTSSIYFYPADTLIGHQTYVVTIDTTVRSKNGYRLPVPYTFSFTTGSN